jgi:TorA maturation chaperone TorD
MYGQVDVLECFASFYASPDLRRAQPDATRGPYDDWEGFTEAVRALTGTLELTQLDHLGIDRSSVLEALASAAFNRRPDQRELACLQNRHFAGGLDRSVVPVESLYRTWTRRYARRQGACAIFDKGKGFYGGDAADHMSSLYRSLGIVLDGPDGLQPDHLVLQLDFLGLLCEHGRSRDKAVFIDEHLSWLPCFLDELREKAPEAEFLITMTVLLIAVIESLRVGALRRKAVQAVPL